jgi:prepilin-type N-terminal cleavage/methylation domain-containing protein
MKNKSHQAFSLIEISVVIVIIGILIAGISSGIELYDDYKLKVAQNITKNSRVNRIPDLEMWLETTGENSLATGTTNFTNKPNPADQDPIGRWNDINPNILPSARNHATQTNPTVLIDNQPKYIRNGINGLPALLFDGSNDFFSFNGDFLVGADYTIFVVEKRLSIKSNTNNCFLAGSSNLALSNLSLGYRSSTSLAHVHWGSGYDFSITIPAFTSPINRIHSFVFSKSTGKAIYINGNGGSKIFNATQNLPIISYLGSSIGNNRNYYYYDGYIAEMIFYTRALSNRERQEVELYLSKKWGIKIG